MDAMIGQVIDNYKIVEIIGKGGMGIVYKAFDMNLEKTVALKMIDPFFARNESFLKRFKTEAKALAKLENKNIVGVYALRETGSGLFMVMEYVPAGTVSDWLKNKGPFSINDTIKIVRQLLNAINHAHKVGVIHRDIKPNNILLCDDGTVKVMDFGLAKLMLEHGEQSTVTQTAGTLYYMSPEQIKGIKIDKRSDIYSIGMTIYEMLTGRIPFEKSIGEFNIQKQIIEGKIKSPDKFNAGIPKDFVNYIMKAIDKNPDKRFQNADEMLKELDKLQLNEIGIDDKTRIIKEEKSNGNKNDKKKRWRIYASAALIIIIIFSAYIIFLKPFNDKNNDIGKKDNFNSGDISGNNNSRGSSNKIKFANFSINSSPPGAAIYIDNKLEGKTPFSKDSLIIKNYSIVLKMAGYNDWQETNYPATQGDNIITAKLKPIIITANSTLILKAIPFASIYVDNKKISSNTNEIIHSKITAGHHRVKFTNPEFGSKELTINLNNNQSKSVTCYFQQQINIQSLNLKGDAFWGTIYVNGKNSGKTTPGDILLGPGTYNITVKKTGYKTVEKDKVLNITPTFQLKTHSLVFHLE